MGRRSSVHGDFLQVKTAMGLERFEDGNSRTASTSLSDLTFLNLEKIDASFHSCSTLAITRVASTLVRVNHFYSLSVNSFGYNSAYPPRVDPLSALTFLSLEKIDASFHSCFTFALTRVASTLVRVNHFYSLSVYSFGYNSAYPPSCRPPFSYSWWAAGSGKKLLQIC